MGALPKQRVSHARQGERNGFPASFSYKSTQP